MRLRRQKRVLNPDKVQPEYNQSESATLALAGAMRAILSATAMRSEDKVKVDSVITSAEEAVRDSYNERMSLDPEVSDWPEPVPTEAIAGNA